MLVLEKIDGILNSITMYRLVLYGLSGLSVVAIISGFFGMLQFNGFQLCASLTTIIVSCYFSNKIFSKLFKADTNVESWLITGLILFLVLLPIFGWDEFIVTILICITAMASKYFLTFEKKHIFNPTAIAIFLAGIFGFGNAIWWIGNSILMPFVLIAGLLVVRKIRRFQMVLIFFASGIASLCFFSLLNNLNLSSSIIQIFKSWPLVFFGTIMLTEPFTTPSIKKYRVVYAVLVGFLYSSQFSFGPLVSSPEFALIAGNIFSFFVNPKGKIILNFKEKTKLAPLIYEFIFKTSPKITFAPGQYLEWTLPHKSPDSRGIRRYFTIASAPDENDVRLGVKIITDKSSSFKEALLKLKHGAAITADQLSGDFIIPADSIEKLVFIAGGIGVTPFRSMIKNIVDKNLKKDIVLFYCSSDPSEFVYKDILNDSKDSGVKTVYVLGGGNPPANWIGESGYITEEMIVRHAPDFKSRTYYLSGPVAMVDNYKRLLGKLGIETSKIVTDYFPGY